MKKIRLIVFSVFLIVGLAVAVMMVRTHTQPEVKASLAPAYSVAGRATKAADRAVTHALPIDDLDEAQLGDRIAELYQYETDTQSEDAYYVRKLVKEITSFKKRSFDYRAFVLETDVPNAFAMPGGVIVVTTGLLDMLDSEAQLVAILAHEMGHVEIGHCMDAVKFTLLAQKADMPSMGMLADMTMRLLLEHSYSKTEEDEADAYAFKLMLETSYNPSALGEAFDRLMAGHPVADRYYRADVINDYLLTHTPTPIRADRYHREAANWWRNNAAERRYNGAQNLTRRMTRSSWEYEDEWVTEQPGPEPQQQDADVADEDDFWK